MIYEHTIKLIQDRLSANNDNLNRYYMSYKKGDMTKSDYNEKLESIKTVNKDLIAARKLLVKTQGDILWS